MRPGRVRAIYIHDASSGRRDGEVDSSARSLAATVPLLRVENAVQAAEHACEHGWITREGLEEVRRECDLDGGPGSRSGQRSGGRHEDVR